MKPGSGESPRAPGSSRAAAHPSAIDLASDALRDLREVAEACARLGGSILVAAREEGPGEIREKARNDFVTEVDAASEHAIAEFLRERHPGHALLAEEAAGEAASYQARPLFVP
ncbi:MAG: hypothetical protein H0V09_11405, partial [Gemmatimonadetes bacterium]|nr:hypothetical protein [Gemmatimonadota bacterium]